MVTHNVPTPQGVDVSGENKDNDTPLMIAATVGRQYLSIMEYLILQGANINHRNRINETALHKNLSWVGEPDLATIQFLVDKGSGNSIGIFLTFSRNRYSCS